MTARDAAEAVFETVPDPQWNEATTRKRLVDGLLEAVGWTRGVHFEPSSGSGDFLDYLLQWEHDPWMVVEAKRVGKTFYMDPAATRSTRSNLRAIAGLLNKGGPDLRAAMQQAASYANDRATPYCAVTNGEQWVFFRGMSSRDKPWNNGRALVFLSRDDIRARFDDFLHCLGREGTRSRLPELLDQPTLGELPEPIEPQRWITFRQDVRDKNLLARLQVVSSYLFSDIVSDSRVDMLDRCYVSPTLESGFDTTIRRLLADRADTLADDDVKEGAVDDFTNEVELREQVLQHPVLVVGHIGAGKTTFIHRALRQMKLDHRNRRRRANTPDDELGERLDQAAFSAVVDLEGFGRAGTFDSDGEHQRVADEVIKQLGRCVTGVLSKRKDLSDGARTQGDPNHTETLSTLCRTRLDEVRNASPGYWAEHEELWGQRRLEVFDKYRADKVQWLIHYIQHLRARFERPKVDRQDEARKYPVLIALDNIDQATTDYQRCIYGFAQRLARGTDAVVVVVLREDTYGEGRLPRGFLSSTPLSFVFHVKAPALDHVVRSRVQYAERIEQQRKLPSPLRGVEAELPEWRDRAQRLLEGRDSGVQLIGALAGQNTRAALDLCGRAVRHLGAESISRAGGVLRALIAGSTSSTLTERVGIANIFDAGPSVPVFHGLRSRLLAYFASVLHSGQSHQRPWHEQSQVAVARFCTWGYPTPLVRTALRDLLQQGLLCDARSRRSDVSGELPVRMSISAAGHVHLMQLSRDRAYRAIMACSCRWFDQEQAQVFARHANAQGSGDGCSFSELLNGSAVAFFEAYLQQQIAMEDRVLTPLTSAWTRDVRALSDAAVHVEAARAPLPVTHGQASTEAGRASVAPSDHPVLFPVRETESHGGPSMGRIVRSSEAHGSVWVPRILWALEYGRQSGWGPLSPSQIATVLTEHGGIPVPHNNISRAFRDLKRQEVAVLWKISGRRYSITASGTALIEAIIAGASGG